MCIRDRETGDGSKKDSSCGWCDRCGTVGGMSGSVSVSYTHLKAHEGRHEYPGCTY